MHDNPIWDGRKRDRPFFKCSGALSEISCHKSKHSAGLLMLAMSASQVSFYLNVTLRYFQPIGEGYLFLPFYSDGKDNTFF